MAPASPSSSSSSDFSSDDEYAPAETGFNGSNTHSVQVEVLDDSEYDDSAALDSLSAVLPVALIESIQALLAPSEYGVTRTYEDFTTALYHFASHWSQEPRWQRAQHRVRAAVFARFQALYPLTPEMYADWISDMDATQQKLRLHDMAQRDYLSVPLAMQRLQLQHVENADAAWQELQSAMDTALATAGTHYTQGHEVWQLCREVTAEYYDRMESEEAE
ncbi:hypothetical protein P43SY_011391 [Pythium insidiosum]|uniref:Uncharacterized protein n=1 Tax=Pythium insidiosum TaxID=114742 RepID=A0AAD5Q4C0_PYTIN|nr:hypothetical protein P43SY_011391 [Pythium insidiosum]